MGEKIGSCALTFAQIKNNFDFFSELLTTKNWSVCADFSPIKNLSDVIQKVDLACHCHTQSPRQNIGPCALTQSEKKSDFHSAFFSELLTTKNRSVCAGHKTYYLQHEVEPKFRFRKLTNLHISKMSAMPFSPSRRRYHDRPFS